MSNLAPASPPPARRSCLSVPASSASKLAKARELGADEVVIDLEDSVAPDAKHRARDATVHELADWAGPGVSVRINAPRTRWCHLDLAELVALERELVSVVVPKVESAGDMAFLDRLLDGLEAASGRSHPLRLQALLETPAGLARADEIAAASPRLETLILGYADLAASLGRTTTGAALLDAWLPAQHTVLVAARRHGLQAIDGPYLGTGDDEPFRAAAQRARELGFDGKWAIHPAQVPALNELFSPSEQELAHARAVIDALSEAERAGAGAVALEGEMLDEAVRLSALRVLARDLVTDPAP
jgi:citrate lyase subunit beta / citryl-CoA lyase